MQKLKAHMLKKATEEVTMQQNDHEGRTSRPVSYSAATTPVSVIELSGLS